MKRSKGMTMALEKIVGLIILIAIIILGLLLIKYFGTLGKNILNVFK